MNNRPRVREKERCKLVRKYGYAGYYIKFVLPQKQNAEKEGNVAENDLIRRRDVLKLIEDIKCDDGIPKNHGRFGKKICKSGKVCSSYMFSTGKFRKQCINRCHMKCWYKFF